MFKCSKCEAQENEISFLREEIRRLTDRLIAMANPIAYQAVNQSGRDSSEFYGFDTDEMISYNEFGQKIIVTKN